MSAATTTVGQERQNRKILEQLEEQKKQLRMQQLKSTSPVPSPSSSTNLLTTSSPLSTAPHSQVQSTDPPHMSAAQKAALTHAHANSVGYFITQESAFGNLILPVLPRFLEK